MTRPTAILPARGRHTVARITRSPMTLDPDGDPDFVAGWSCDWTATTGEGCPAPTPVTCQGPTDWPPMTPIQRYAAARAAGECVPPSVSTWRPEDVARQREADRYARAQAPAREPQLLPWGPGPGCEGVR